MMVKTLSNLAGIKLSELSDAGLYRKFVELSHSSTSSFPEFELPSGKQVVNFSSNDYLGMSQNSKAKIAAINAISLNGVGAGGSRNIGGTSREVLELEQETAELHRAESALYFSSGYEANRTTLAALSSTKTLGCQVFSDQENHASIIDGLQLLEKGSSKFVFAHNDLIDLENELFRHRDGSRPGIIVVESIYSMSGTKAPLSEIIRIAVRFDCSVVLNEVHAVGVIGTRGQGYLGNLDDHDRVDLILGTYAKGFGTQGGYVAGKRDLVDVVRQFGRGFIFTTASSPANIAATLSNVKHLKESNLERDRLRNRLATFSTALKSKYPLVTNDTHILPLLVGSEHEAKLLAKAMEERGIYVTPVTFPTVPRGAARLRVTITPLHTDRHLDLFVNALGECWKTLHLPSAA